MKRRHAALHPVVEVRSEKQKTQKQFPFWSMSGFTNQVFSIRNPASTYRNMGSLKLCSCLARLSNETYQPISSARLEVLVLSGCILVVICYQKWKDLSCCDEQKEREGASGGLTQDTGAEAAGTLASSQRIQQRVDLPCAIVTAGCLQRKMQDVRMGVIGYRNKELCCYFIDRN